MFHTRISFRQLLVVAFLFVTGLLAAVPLRALFMLEALMAESRRGAAQEVELNRSLQVLTERSVTMERAARQYLVLNDPALRDRFMTAAAEGAEALERRASGGPAPEGARAWHEQIGTIREMFANTRGSLRVREQRLVAAFRELDRINDAIAQQMRSAAHAQNQALLDALDASRREMARQVLGAFAAAFVLAIAFGVWLSRPLKRVENAIVGLGENRLDEPIDIQGPADVRLVGRRLDWLRLRLAELDSDKARFLRKVSHEFKTPLAALREGVSLLGDGVAGTLNPRQGGVVRILSENTALLEAQIEELLRFNAAAFEARRIVRRPTELGALVAAEIGKQRLQAERRGLRVEVQGAPLVADVDADKIGTAVANLLSNAIRFSPRDGTIVIGLRRDEATARIDVWDEGPGVAPADRLRIFEPFYRGETQPTDATVGSGIGLSIVHEYITAHGGNVRLLPEGPGARFQIELPHAITE